MPTKPQSSLESGIRDNHTRGTVGDFLRDKIQAGSKLSIVSAYFTIYAYEVILAAKRANTLTDIRPQADTSTLEGEIDQLVYQLYGLTEDEVKIVEGKG